jgi:hypothetical protein
MGLILLLIVGGYVGLAIGLTRDLKGKSKRNSMIFFIGLPLLLGFSFIFRPSFYHFVSLCSDHETRYVVDPIELDYVPPIGGCYFGYTTMVEKNYLGFECEHSVEKPSSIEKNRQYENKLFRLTKNVNWNNLCEKECNHYNTQWEEKCQDVCFSKVEITDTPSVKKYSYRGNSGSGPTYEHVTSVANSDKKQHLQFKNYVYHLYGNKLARYLGGASGDSPTMKCNFEYDYDTIKDFLKPKKQFK